MAQEIVANVKASDTVLRLSRVGGTPYLHFNPYTNNDGVKVHQWDCISYHFEAHPGKALLSYPHIVMPWNEESWEVNLITDEWVIGQLMHHREGDIELIDFEESPFDSQIINDWD